MRYLLDYAQSFLGSVTPLAAFCVVVYVLIRSRTPRLLKDELEIQRAKCERIEKEKHDLEQDNHAKDIEIAALRAKTDVSDIRKTQTQLLEMFREHSQAMVTNNMEVLRVCRDIANTLSDCRAAFKMSGKENA